MLPVTKRRTTGFSLVELLVAITISGILIAITISVYSTFRRNIALDESRAQSVHNARITLDRLSRELRQTSDIVTNLPASATDSSITQPGEIEFADGHTNDLTYRRYYIQDGGLKLDIKEYYFEYDPATRVHWNDVGNGGVAPVVQVLATHDVADQLDSLIFYGTDLLEIVVTTEDADGNAYQLRTGVSGRNTILGESS